MGNRKYGQAQGFSQTTEYKLWINMVKRCHNPKHISFKYYGGRGIAVYKPWRDNFIEFRNYLLKTIGLKPDSSLTLDRIDNDGDYRPGNIRWATPEEQQANTRAKHRTYEYDGRLQTVSEWASEFGINKKTLSNRLGRGMNIHEALNKPVRARIDDNGTAFPIKIGKCYYYSFIAASRDLDISLTQVKERMNDPNFPEYKQWRHENE